MNKLLICMAVACVSAANVAAQSFSAATYNIRQLNAKDTAAGNGWEQRLPVISSLIRFHDFDIFGAQEVFHSQLQDMLAALPGYDYVGVGRDDGAAGGEYSAIFYKRGRFKLLDSDHRGEQAQAESCRLILAKIEELCHGERVILTGDFNVGRTSPSYAILRDSGLLSDTYDTAEIRYAETGTENRFDPDIKTFRRIDYVSMTRRPEPRFRARTPSDHFPVQVELEFTKR